MFLKVLMLVTLASSQARQFFPEEFQMREVDDIHALGLGHQCDAGIPSLEGCAVQEPNGKFLIIAPLNSGKKFVKLDVVYGTGLWPYGCKFGYPTVDGCVVQDSHGKFIVLGPVRNLDPNQQ